WLHKAIAIEVPIALSLLAGTSVVTPFACPQFKNQRLRQNFVTEFCSQEEVRQFEPSNQK
ncbi:MAG: hypothetical protein NZ805_08425, partial [Armatimonadetes bacterium]|nr:hypothetical protein [Armatimonadota bacterium]